MRRRFCTQVWRSQPVTLGVTFEAAILCDISQGLSYAWSLTTYAGLRVPLPPPISIRRRTLTIPGFFLEPGNYTALAKVGCGSGRHPGRRCPREQGVSPSLTFAVPLVVGAVRKGACTKEH